jgi:transposase
MPAERTDMHTLSELVRLHRLKKPARTIARLLHIGPNTERKYRRALAEAGLLDGAPDALPPLQELLSATRTAFPPPPPQPSPLQAYADEVALRLRRGKRPRAIFDELRTRDPHFPGSYSAVKRLCARLQKQTPISPESVRIPVQTAPGEVAQVDFGYVGMLYDPDAGVLRKAWVFVMVLGFSRKLFARIVLDQSTDTFVRLHEDAFTYFGGVVRTVVPDNLKAAVLRAAFGADRHELALNRSYRELARHYGFVVDPTAPRTPEHKGKVESAVKYVKRNFFAGSDFQDLEDAQRRLQIWVDSVADQRIHGATRRRPQELFTESEQESLLPLPLTPFSHTEWRLATVHPDSHIQFRKHLYSVPFSLIGKQVWVRADAHFVTVFSDDQSVATHPRKAPGFRSTYASHLPAGREALRRRSRAFWEERAEALGPEVLSLVRAVFASDEVLCQLRKVQAIVTLLEKHPKERAQNAARRALHFGCLSYQGVSQILRKGLDFAPLPTETPPSSIPKPAPAYARDLASLLSHVTTKEDSHDWN